MSQRLAIANLLNPVPEQAEPSLPSPSLPSPSGFNPEISPRKLLHEHYQLTRKTILEAVYSYAEGSIVEYPETGTTENMAIGHLFAMGSEPWSSPCRNFVYSQGAPRGKSRETVTVPLLVDESTGEMVPCIERHSTCQGVKICPASNFDNETSRHSAGSREVLQARLQYDRELQQEAYSPERDVFERTSALITAIMRVGCTSQNALDLELQDINNIESSTENSLERRKLRRGYPDIPKRCTGQIIFGYTSKGTPFIKCEHHSRWNRDHFFDGSVGNGRYHTEYLNAILTKDDDRIDLIENQAMMNGYGPRAPCQIIFNKSSQRITCGSNHRDFEQKSLKQMELINLPCSCTFREYEPIEEFRNSCPYVLVVCRGVHPHPVPIPEKTPASIRSEVEELLRKLDLDLADMTPRLFLRHPIVKLFLSARFPLLKNPMLSDLHISLSNRSHLKVYIQNVQKAHFPMGTGWKGLIHLKQQQDSLLEPNERYIRRIIQVPASSLLSEDDDVPEDEPLKSSNEPLRIVICMTTDASQRLIRAQYLQSDIGFKRVVGFYEFEIASVDTYTNTSITFCRVYLTRQTAFAHKTVLEHINDVLVEDTGRGLTWRHTHGSNINDYQGHILNWVVDQHGGQAKGIGLYLQALAKTLPSKADFHQPFRLIQDLTPYDHLQRFLTLCTTHYSRNIHKCAVPEEVRNLMRSLSCITHDDWSGTIHAILDHGGIAAQNWVADKERAQFAFPALCWEKSFIPLDIWQARRRESNVVETVHANVNLEGKQCTLVGGVGKGFHYDLMKQRALKDREQFGVRESYSLKHLSDNAKKNYQWKAYGRRKSLQQEDAKIENHNRKINELFKKLHQKQASVQSLYNEVYPGTSSSSFVPSARAIKAFEKAQIAERKAIAALEKQVKAGRELAGTGSGNVYLVLPSQ